jgi:hypothetical protein
MSLCLLLEKKAEYQMLEQIRMIEKADVLQVSSLTSSGKLTWKAGPGE